MKECPKCNDHEMELGDVTGPPHIYFERTKMGPREGYIIDGYRCPNCGYVELSATCEVSPKN